MHTDTLDHADFPDAGTAHAAQVWRPSPEVFLFAKGRVALYAILKAMGIGPGDEVLVPGYTCVVVPSAVAYTGARPVYYDIDPDTYNGRPEDAVSKITGRTRALLLQHTYGIPGGDKALVDQCRERGIKVIEDCAHAMGGTLNGRPLGTLGDAAFASYQWSKPVSLGLGGTARINNESLLPRFREMVADNFSEPSFATSISLAALSWTHRKFMTPRLYWSARAAYHALGRFGLVAPSSSGSELSDPDVMPPGYCRRFGRPRRRQLPNAMNGLPEAVAHSNMIAGLYQHWFQEKAIKPQRCPPGAVPMYLRYPVMARERDKLLDSARANRIELGDWFNAPLHPDVWRSPGLRYEPGMCPNAERVSSHVVNLPTHRRIDLDEADRILAFLGDHEDLLLR